ncbi:hypothetical protein [Actinoplanes friuliensis]|uniref:Uncharacterized protein n=1 Tax=Actinoplanes friuliensis DSM 7358 TaxID=1246995 RepID=U5VUQ0_9ACTN|nr:hypothetical protein [Actinoplanes friuliensis]AGZ39376.1 hypothetical protein AFR_05435 [Actinoplanes friuliensis DSM 7358]
MDAAEISRAGVVAGAKINLIGMLIAAAVGGAATTSAAMITFSSKLKDAGAATAIVVRQDPNLDIPEIILPPAMLGPQETSPISELDGRRIEDTVRRMGMLLMTVECEPGERPRCTMLPEMRPSARLEVRTR